MLLDIIFKPPMTEDDEAQVRLRIDRAKIAIMQQPSTTFFSALLANLKLLINREKPTGATDGIHLWLNPDYVAAHDNDELMFLLMHEIMHVALDHCNWEIYKDLNQYVLGLSMDHFINLYLIEMGYKFIEGGYADPKYKNWSSMEIYRDLMKNPPEPPPDWQPDAIGKPDDMTHDEHKARVEDNMIKAALQAEMAGDPGSIPGNIKIKIKEMISPQLPWNLILYKYMDQYSKDDFSWSRPNRRFLPHYYLPNLQGEKLEGVVSAVDVSGSMMNEIDEVMAENRYVKSLLGPDWFHFITFDTEIHHNKIYDEFEQLPEDDMPDGGAGGTYLEPIIKYIVDECPAFALIFTDGYFTPPDMKGVESDIYWIISQDGDSDFRAPHGIGTVIHMN